MIVVIMFLMVILPTTITFTISLLLAVDPEGSTGSYDAPQVR